MHTSGAEVFNRSQKPRDFVLPGLRKPIRKARARVNFRFPVGASTSAAELNPAHLTFFLCWVEDKRKGVCAIYCLSTLLRF